MNMNKFVLAIVLALSSFGALALDVHLLELEDTGIEIGEEDYKGRFYANVSIQCRHNQMSVYVDEKPTDSVTANGYPDMPTFVIANNLQELKSLNIGGYEIPIGELQKDQKYQTYLMPCIDDERSTFLDQNQKEH